MTQFWSQHLQTLWNENQQLGATTDMEMCDRVSTNLMKLIYSWYPEDSTRQFIETQLDLYTAAISFTQF